MAGLSVQPGAIRLTEKDNVATLLDPVAAGGVVPVNDLSGAGGGGVEVTARAAIPAGHKIALEAIAAGSAVIKYGLPIAHAKASIASGEHVHVHNAVSNISAKPTNKPATTAAPAASISAEALRSLLLGYLASNDVPERVAVHMTEHCLEAHLRGVETHGIRRIKPYVARLRAGGVDRKAEPEIDLSSGLLRIDGRNGVGHHVATVAADAVAEAAKTNGAAVALVRNSNHFGFAGYYATRIAAQGMAAMVTSNGQVLVGPKGARRAIFSNDPLAIAAPLSADAFFEFDMATSVTSRANIVQAAASGGALAPGMALNSEGNPTTNAKAAAGGILLPFGGDKGFAFIAAIELLTGVLTGGAYADQVASKESSVNTPEGTAYFMLAIDLELALGRSLFEQRLQDMVQRMTALPMKTGSSQPRHPGARRWAHRRERLAGGIPLTATDADTLRSLADEIGMPIGF